MNERLRELRRSMNLTQQEFANRIGITRNTLASYETGKSNPGDAAVSLICSKLNVSEVWLRTGEGEMFRERSTEDILMEFAKDVSYEGDESFKKRFINAIAQMDDEGWNHFEKWLSAFLEKYQKPASAAAAVDPDKEAEAYRQELLVQKSPEERSKASDGTEEKDA